MSVAPRTRAAAGGGAERGRATAGPRRSGGRVAAVLRHPLPRLLGGGALLALLLHASGGGMASSGAVRTIASTAPAPPSVGGAPGGVRASGPGTAGRPADDELLTRAAAAAVSVDDPVVRGRLLRLAQYLEMGGTAEEPSLARDGDGAPRPGDDELIAAARDLGLAAQDVVLRRYLAEIARLALAQPERADLPGEDELRAWIAAHPERFTVPARVRARQVYLSATRRGTQLANDAAMLLERLRAEATPPESAALLGDAFARGTEIDGAHDAIARAFGDQLARRLDELPLGSWQGPIASPFGLHLVWIEERSVARPATFDEVCGRALHAYLRERGAARAQGRLAALRCRAREARPDAAAGHQGDACAG